MTLITRPRIAAATFLASLGLVASYVQTMPRATAYKPVAPIALENEPTIAPLAEAVSTQFAKGTAIKVNEIAKDRTFATDPDKSTRYAILQVMLTNSDAITKETNGLLLRNEADLVLKAMPDVMDSLCASEEVKTKHARAAKVLLTKLKRQLHAPGADAATVLGSLRNGIRPESVTEVNLTDGEYQACVDTHIPAIFARHRGLSPVRPLGTPQIALPQGPVTAPVQAGAATMPAVESQPAAAPIAQPAPRKRREETPTRCLGLSTVLCDGGVSEAPAPDEEALPWATAEVTRN